MVNFSCGPNNNGNYFCGIASQPDSMSLHPSLHEVIGGAIAGDKLPFINFHMAHHHS